MNILFLAKQFPWPLNVGSRQRVFHLIRGLSATHDVSVIAFDAPPTDEHLQAFCSAVGSVRPTIVPRPQAGGGQSSGSQTLRRLGRGVRMLKSLVTSPTPSFVRSTWSKALVDAIEQAAGSRRIDVVYATQSWMAEHARAAGLSPIVVDVDDLISMLSKQRLASSPWSARTPVDALEAAKDMAYERRLPKRFSRVVVAKKEDLAFFDARDRDRVTVIPNGISIPPAPLPEPRVANRILFIGTLGYAPNIDAITWFATEILPVIWRQRPDVHFDVAGYGSGAAVKYLLADPRCTLRESPPDLTPLYAEAAVVVAPVRIGGGTRIKILEALARGRALVSTVFAAEGLDLRGGIDLEFADTPAAIADRCVALLADGDRRKALAAAGRARVADHYNWETIERSMPDIVANLSA